MLALWKIQSFFLLRSLWLIMVKIGVTSTSLHLFRKVKSDFLLITCKRIRSNCRILSAVSCPYRVNIYVLRLFWPLLWWGSSFRIIALVFYFWYFRPNQCGPSSRKVFEIWRKDDKTRAYAIAISEKEIWSNFFEKIFQVLYFYISYFNKSAFHKNFSCIYTLVLSFFLHISKTFLDDGSHCFGSKRQK